MYGTKSILRRFKCYMHCKFRNIYHVYDCKTKILLIYKCIQFNKNYFSCSVSLMPIQPPWGFVQPNTPINVILLQPMMVLQPGFQVTYVLAKIRAFQVLQLQLNFALIPQKFVKQIAVEHLGVKVVQMVNVRFLHLFVTSRAGNVFADPKSLMVTQSIIRMAWIISLQTPARVIHLQACLLVEQLEIHVTLDIQILTVWIIHLPQN